MHPNFFLGEIREYSRFYFPVMFMLKESLIINFALMFSIVYFFIGRFKFKLDAITIIGLTGGFMLLGSTLNLGLRHMLVIYPYIIIFMIQMISKLNIRLVWFLLFAQVVFAFSQSPNFISSFNILIGDNGYKYSDGSNLDWKQNDAIWGNDHPSIFKASQEILPEEFREEQIFFLENGVDEVEVLGGTHFRIE